MDKEIVIRLHSSFEAMIQKLPGTETEFWCARDLQMLLGYTRWENFAKVVDKGNGTVSGTFSRDACQTNGGPYHTDLLRALGQPMEGITGALLLFQGRRKEGRRRMKTGCR